MDSLSQARRSANMAAIRSKDSKPELLVRKLAHSLGYRFRLHRKTLPGKPDLVFVSHRKIIFVHGCFWHQHPEPECLDARLPKSNTAYWLPKLTRNMARDSGNKAMLAQLGWRVLVIRECETKATACLKENLISFLRD